MILKHTYNGSDSKSYATEANAEKAIKKANLGIPGDCSFIIAHCPKTGRYVPIVLNGGEAFMMYARQGFRTFG